MLFDTSVLIDYLTGRNATATHYVTDIISGQPGDLSIIAEAELWVGVRNRREEETIEALASLFTVIPLNSGIVRDAFTLMRQMDISQRKVHLADALIAATALEIGETVLTADRRSSRVFGNWVRYLVYR